MKKEVKIWHIAVGWMISNLIFTLIHPMLGILNNFTWMFILIVKGIKIKN